MESDFQSKNRSLGKFPGISFLVIVTRVDPTENKIVEIIDGQ
jgi:hypothetical protein